MSKRKPTVDQLLRERAKMADRLVELIKSDLDSTVAPAEVAVFVDEWRGTREAGKVIAALVDEAYERRPDGTWERCIFPLVGEVL